MSADFNHEETVTARKAHRCEESGGGCTKKIRAGDAYTKLAGLFDGDFYSAKLCARCARLYHKVWQREPYSSVCQDDGGPLFGSLLYWLKEARKQ